MKTPRDLGWVAPTLALVGFVGVTVVFVREMRAFRAAVLEWAGNDLESRSQIAAATLREPLRTGDFNAVHAFNRRCALDHVRLSIFGKPKGLVFDSLGGFGDLRRDAGYIYSAEEDVGEFRIMLGLPLDHVLAPFRRARTSFALAVLSGVAGMLVVFVTLYRQRVHIRELRRLERFRREFVADVSHEIKTPLTGILGAVDLLADGVADDAARGRLLGMLAKESKRLDALVRQILDLARLERDGAAPDRVATDMGALVHETVDSLRPRAEAAGIALVCAVPPMPVVLDVDAALVAEAVASLVENAISHSRSPDVAVSVSSTAKDVSVAVEDHGVGIPAEHADRVFERFHRVDPARAAESGGAGLGLAIVRRIARLHGGDVTLAPVRPHGCRFVVALPRR